jgi:hypothetical protein
MKRHDIAEILGSIAFLALLSLTVLLFLSL